MALTDKLTAIGNAIRTKTGGSALIPLSDMPAEILSIETGAAPLQNPALILMDWDGTKLAEYSREDAVALTELPEPNTLQPYEGVEHEYLSFQEWNWDIENIKSWVQSHENETLLVGSIYITTDNQDHKSWEDLRLDNDKVISSLKKRNGYINTRQWSNFTSLKKVSIPYKISPFGEQAFQGCVSLKTVNLPSETINISRYTFSGCNNLISVSIPSELTTIGAYAFQSCSSLKSINIPDGVTTIGAYAFQGCISFKSLIIPDGVTTIEASTFQNCRSLESFNIPDGVTSIGANAFQGCSSLKSITIPDEVTSVGQYAFNNCYKLLSVTLSKKMSSLPAYIFSTCSSLLNIDILSNITTIGQYAFENCLSLKDILIRGTPSLTSTTAFNGNPSNQKIYVPRSNLSWFEAETNWSAIFSKFVAIEDYIEHLEALGFNVDEYKEAA